MVNFKYTTTNKKAVLNRTALNQQSSQYPLFCDLDTLLYIEFPN
ncbi:hypothetical protein CLV25_10774 [Acetobacteroides hydrogenigenes]|uniref:Uncharacterized protein n=1 Tax=Acetobacteroides hydrogenigenes TaxID=979970 RepID=A0A4R2EHD3_9BACT|nr:hypothetical protein CLV25_10774 [Acetobacteroides hydrogenigenes]